MSKCQKNSLRVLWYFILFLNATNILAQSNYTLVSCPQICLKDKESFNNVHGKARTDEDYFSAVRAEFSKCKQGKVRFAVKRNSGVVEYYSYVIQGEFKKENFASLSSKGVDKDILESRDDLKNYFADTIAVMELVKIRVRLQDMNLRKEGYYLECRENGASITLPNVRDTILMDSGLFEGYQRTTQFVLKNKSKPDRILATFVLHLPDSDELDNMRSLVWSLHESFPQKDDKEIAKLYNAIRELGYGELKSSDVHKIINP
ncbi:MAG: hypothetical protein IPP69_11545 [Flavobacteriales bacterium]|nr:hypothetical protein [Flavobacteriales bacterium]